MVQIISLTAAIIFFLQVVFYTSKKKLQDQQAFFWIMIAGGGILIAAFLPLLNNFASLVGISYMPTLVFMFAFLIVVNILIYQTRLLSSHQEKIKTLAQEIAYINHELNKKNSREE
ncbi:DUF2304 domain-containing protein [Virgibacillus sp. JSM 102003]|uniref:DUF2304 domain-containing protein n=1 Tax=Virgibacillus sp. JSM 102003 TaxID=1562108 RepID=UPI0035BFDEC1